MSNQKDANDKAIHFASMVSFNELTSKSSSGVNFEGGVLLDKNISEISGYVSHEENSESESHLSVNSKDHLIDRKKALNKILNLIDDNQNCLYHHENESYKQLKDSFMLQEQGTINIPHQSLKTFNIKPISVAGVSQVTKVVKPAGAGVPRKNKKLLNKDHLSADKKILFSAQESLCLSVEDFAKCIGVSSYVMSSYLYREQVNPKQWVVEAAVELLNERSELFLKIKKIREEYDNKEMSEILMMWSNKLNFDLSSNKEVALILGTTSTTILRWKHDQNLPSLLSLQAYYETGLANTRSRKIGVEKSKTSKKISKLTAEV